MTGCDIKQGNCLDILPALEANSVDSIITDPPYGLNFMGKDWDHGVPGVHFWVEALRVAKPGAHLLAFGGTRTFHRLTCAIEDAGWEIRDCLGWLYGSGFPKSADVSKMMDKHEQKRWLDVCKELDNVKKLAILMAWKEYLKTANNAGLLFRKSETETGTNTLKNGFAAERVQLQADSKNSDAGVLVAELSFIEARRTSGVNCSSAQSLAENNTTELRSRAISAANQPENQEATLAMPDSSALQSAWGWQGESTADKLKAVEALKIWLGSKPSSRMEITSALCAALTDDLRLIILSQSKTFQSFDTTRKTACASAINVIITESTAESLISFTVDTLRSKAIDKIKKVERKDAIKGGHMGVAGRAHGLDSINDGGLKFEKTTPAIINKGSLTRGTPVTSEAHQWQGFGTALKPAWEPIILARKPIKGTVVDNVLRYGTGAINIDGCRIETEETITNHSRYPESAISKGKYGDSSEQETHQTKGQQLGRFPANLIHDGSDEVLGLFPITSSTKPHSGNGNKLDTREQGWGFKRMPCSLSDNGGSAARFFYCAKASKKDRDEGCDGLEEKMVGMSNGAQIHGEEYDKGQGIGLNVVKAMKNHHPTVKPVALMQYLCRLVTPPGGIVLDPFMGSGSTGKAALLEGFKFIGIELEKEYVKIAKRRINVVQPLFAGECA